LRSRFSPRPPSHASAQQTTTARSGEIAPAHCTLTKATLCKEGGCTPSDSFGELKLPTKVSIDFLRRFCSASALTASRRPRRSTAWR
jgi:hypothetical protein